MTTILISGGAGFLGSHLVNHLLKETDWSVEVWDCLNYSSRDAWRLRKIGAFDSERFRFVNLDLAEFIARTQPFDYIVHLAAETHVDNSIKDARLFVRSNIVGTFNLLEYARKIPNLKKFLYFSTDEVFGPSPDGDSFHEWSRYNSSNPYSATKAAGEELSMAWENTYKLPVVVSHCCNVFGTMQHPEKFIPKLVTAINGGHRIGIHANEAGESGSRMYVYVGDVVRAICLILEHGEVRQKYNIPGIEVSNEEMAHCVAKILGKEVICEKSYPFSERPGLDFRYSISSKHLYDLGWGPTPKFKVMLKQVVEDTRSEL
jgi:dTDP-glucose 4,6-dehydratase